MDLKALHAFIYGRVQGVGYRAFTKKTARELNLRGFVKNLSDGSVEVYAEGEENKLKRFLEYLYEGPYFAKVEKIEYEFLEPRGSYEDFIIAY